MGEIERMPTIPLRTLLVPIFLSMLAEFFLFLIFGVYLNPEGNLLYKFFWTVIFCGMGMGGSLGAFIGILIVGRLTGKWAIVATTLLTIGILCGVCDLLCISLDEHFRYFGSYENPLAFWVGGLFSATVGGFLIGWLLFSHAGAKLLDKAGI